KIAGIHNGTTQYAKEMMALGYQFITISSDYRAMSSFAQNIVKEMKEIKCRYPPDDWRPKPPVHPRPPSCHPDIPPSDWAGPTAPWRWVTPPLRAGPSAPWRRVTPISDTARRI
ncbi:MAG: hypothetical protein QF701_13055, partial [Nitrospinota bacterium]|nr:hypothetical protein [Nitrospinota bacterium]